MFDWNVAAQHILFPVFYSRSLKNPFAFPGTIMWSKLLGDGRKLGWSEAELWIICSMGSPHKGNSKDLHGCRLTESSLIPDNLHT